MVLNFLTKGERENTRDPEGKGVSRPALSKWEIKFRNRKGEIGGRTSPRRKGKAAICLEGDLPRQKKKEPFWQGVYFTYGRKKNDWSTPW